jgi:hypothetical protein
MYKPTVSNPEKFQKIRPKDLTSPHWYDVAALESLIFAHIKDAREGNSPDLPIGGFIRQFRGLTRPDKAKEVGYSMNGIRRLSDFAEMDQRVRRYCVKGLLSAMQREAEKPSHKVLGKLGRNHFKARFEEMYGIEIDRTGKPRFWYQEVEGYHNGIPYRFEVALAEIEDLGQFFTGINYSPTFGDPLSAMRLVTPEESSAFGLENLLRDLHVMPEESIWTAYSPADEQPFTAVAIHFISPAVSYKDLGKSTIDVGDFRIALGRNGIATAVYKVAEKIYKEEKRRRKRAGRPAREESEAKDEPDLKAAAFMVMEDAVAHVSGNGTLPYGARRLFSTACATRSRRSPPSASIPREVTNTSRRRS